MTTEGPDDLSIPIRARLECDSLWARSRFYLVAVAVVSAALFFLVGTTEEMTKAGVTPVLTAVACVLAVAAAVSIVWIPDLILFGTVHVIGLRHGHPKASLVTPVIAGALAVLLYADLSLVLFAVLFRDAPFLAMLGAAGLVLGGCVLTALVGAAAHMLASLVGRRDRDGEG